MISMCVSGSQVLGSSPARLSRLENSGTRMIFGPESERNCTLHMVGYVRTVVTGSPMIRDGGKWNTFAQSRSIQLLHMSGATTDWFVGF